METQKTWYGSEDNDLFEVVVVRIGIAEPDEEFQFFKNYEYSFYGDRPQQQESEPERNYREKQEAIRASEIQAQQERDRKLREMYGILTKEHKKVDGEL